MILRVFKYCLSLGFDTLVFGMFNLFNKAVLRLILLDLGFVNAVLPYLIGFVWIGTQLFIVKSFHSLILVVKVCFRFQVAWRPFCIWLLLVEWRGLQFTALECVEWGVCLVVLEFVFVVFNSLVATAKIKRLFAIVVKVANWLVFTNWSHFATINQVVKQLIKAQRAFFITKAQLDLQVFNSLQSWGWIFVIPHLAGAAKEAKAGL